MIIMKKKFTISMAMLFIAVISFAQSSDNGFASNYALAPQTANHSGLDRLKNIDPQNPVIFSSSEEIKSNSNEAKMFPGLAHFNEKIIIKNLAEPSSIRIFDYTGRLIQKLSSAGNSVQINNLKMGNYFVNITGMQSGYSSVKKLSVIN